MEAEPQNLTSEQIESLFNDRALLDAIDLRLSVDNELSLTVCCIELHNAGRIDLLSIVAWPDFESLSGHSFFTVQHFLDAVIPCLDTSVERMMDFIAQLVAKGGNDHAANLPNQAFIGWCAADFARAREVIDKAEDGNPLAIDYLSLALRALKNLVEARRIATTYSDGRRLAWTCNGFVPVA